MFAFVDPVRAPDEKGAYALLIALHEPMLARACRSALRAPGRYVYCGSAKGPGGLRARLARQARAEKSPHWHVDQLTRQGEIMGAWIAINGCECALNAELGSLPIPFEGFGGSDCPRCQSHLRLWSCDTTLPSRWENARKGANFGWGAQALRRTP